jgi:signal transduction histidine kinase
VSIGVSEETAERILTPLLDNASRYASRSITLTCTTGASAGTGTGTGASAGANANASAGAIAGKAKVTGASAVTVYVCDDGPGIPEDFVTSLFEPGRRARPEDGHDGAGLGLALARRLARAAGGDIALDATAPGARFVVTLPAG